jgi:RNA polymerase sigma-70 factor (ECF subfamily)
MRVELDGALAALAPRVFAYALARTGCRTTAEDVAQDALTALVRHWRRAGSPQSPDAFVFAIARRRAGRAVARRALFAPIDAALDLASGAPTPAELHADRERLRAVRSALRRLTRRDREALLLRAVGELSFSDIAAVTHASPAAVKMRVSRARRTLAKLIPEHTNERRTRTA